MSQASNDESFVARLAQQGGVTLFGKLGGRVFSFAFIILVTKAVSPKVYGIFTLALAVIAIIRDVFSFNLHQSIDYFLPKAIHDDDSAAAQELIEFITQVVVLGSLFGVLVVLIAKSRVASFFDTPELAPFLTVLALVVLFQSLVNIQERVFSSFERMEYRVIVSEIGIPFLKLLIIVPLVYIGYEIVGLAYGFLLSVLIAALVGGYFAWRRIDGLNLSVWNLLRPSFSVNPELFNYAFPLYLTGIVYAVSGQASYFVLGFYLGPSEVGVYRVAYQLTTNLMLANLAIAPVFKPMISGSDEKMAIREKYRLAARWVLLLTIPMALVLAVAPDVYLRILFGSDYLAAGAAVVPLSIGYLFNAVTGPESMLIEGTGHTRVILVNSLVMVGMNIALLLILVPPLGVFGAGMAAGLTLIFIPALAVTEIYLLESIHPFSTDTFKFLLSGAISGAIGLGFSKVVSNDYATAVVLPFLIILIYIGIIHLTQGFSADERKIVIQVDKKIGYRILQRFI